MSANEISLIALEVRKWDLENQKINLSSYYLLEDQEKNSAFDVSFLQPPEMVEEFLGKLRYEAEQRLREVHRDEKLEVDFENETFLRQKIYNYFKRITMELNNPRRKKGQPKMILTTHMDLYNENQDVSFLPVRLQFHIILNWARKYYEKEDYKKAIEPLRKLVKVAPDFGLGYKWLARSLKKIRKYEEAMRTYEKYAEVDNSQDAWLDLAKSYRKGKIFERSEEIYRKLLSEEPTNKEARIGMAQIYYANNLDSYLEILDQLFQEDPEWLKAWLIEEFNFRIYIPEKTLLSPTQAAKFLGFKQIFDLTQRAFKNEIPSHFNPTKARLSFYKEELEKWAMAMNRYGCLPGKIELYPDRLGQDDEFVEEAEVAVVNAAQPKPANDRKTTRVEEILLMIRARKAQRAVEQGVPVAEETASVSPQAQPGPPPRRRGRPPKNSRPVEDNSPTTVKAVPGNDHDGNVPESPQPKRKISRNADAEADNEHNSHSEEHQAPRKTRGRKRKPLSEEE